MDLVFGKDTIETALAKASVNRCVDKYGKGPAGKTCAGCVFLFVRVPEVKQSGRYGREVVKRAAKFGCKQSPLTVHEKWWPACALFEASPDVPELRKPV